MGGALHGALTASFALSAVLALRPLLQVNLSIGTTFYAIIFVTSVLRTLWLALPLPVDLTRSPAPVMAFDSHTPWFGTFASEVLDGLGSVSLYAVFLMLIVFWSDLLRQVYENNPRHRNPMTTFVAITAMLFALQVANWLMFLAQLYNSEGVLLVGAVELGVVSLWCAAEITWVSHRFVEVLLIYSEINKEPLDAKIRRIIRMTWAANLFFLVHAAAEGTVAVALFTFWRRRRALALVFAHPLWTAYVAVKPFSEVIILALMLWILQSSPSGGGLPSARARRGYVRVGDGARSGEGLQIAT